MRFNRVNQVGYALLAAALLVRVVSEGQGAMSFWRRSSRSASGTSKDGHGVLVQSLENVPFLFIGNFSWPGHRTSVAAPVRLYELFFAIGLAVWLRSCWPVRSNGYEDVLVWAMPILALFICAYVFKSEIRYRVPFDVYFIPVAIRGWMSILPAPSTDAVGERARGAASLV